MARQNQILTSVKISSPKKSGFDLSHSHRTTGNMGFLIPVYIEEMIPSDRLRKSEQGLTRLSPLVTPMFERCNQTFHTFFVPYRLLWDKFEEWIANKKTAGLLPAFPTVQLGEQPGGVGVEVGDLANYLGIPLSVGHGANETVSAMPFAAYQLIWNEYYRDQNLQEEVDFKLVDGNNTSNADLFDIKKRAWNADYFTKSLPEAQAGAAVDIPLGEVRLKDSTPSGSLANPKFVEMDDHGAVPLGDIANTFVSPDSFITAPGDPTAPLVYDPRETLEVGSTTVEDLRTAIKLQEWLEKAMRGGRRMVELINVFFGIKPQDARLQRPEYITGSVTPIQISETLSTAETDQLPQGNMAGHGVSVQKTSKGTYFAQEWGIVITIMNVQPLTSYAQGIPKHWLKFKDPMQIYWPQFDHLGEQEIEQREIYAFEDGGDTLFGYTPRYAEYKTSTSRTSGQFLTDLKQWTMYREFSAPPVLDETFIVCDPTDRVWAVTDPDVHKLMFHIWNDVQMIRPMSKYSTPRF